MGNKSRRRFLKSTATVTGAGLLSSLPLVSAKEAIVSSDIVDFGNGIEPVVQLIEKTPRNRLLEEVASRIKKGLSYREVLAGLLLAGIRNVQPRPSVGFKFHCVLVVNSCHLASLSGPDSDRWLPLFWGLDYFKSSQSDEATRSGWKMLPVKEAQVPRPTQARDMFVSAMDNWDVEKADAATAGIVRHLGASEVFELLVRYAARDYRSIGHKAIYLANCWRTLQVIGWEFAEPVVRSLVFALLNHNGVSNPSKGPHPEDLPWIKNGEKLKAIPDTWLGGKSDDSFPPILFETFRSGSPDDSSSAAVDALKKKVSPQSIWDGVFVGAAELLMRQPGIIGLHGLTTANAMHFLWRQTADETIRKQLLLQACSFNPMFRESAKGRGKLSGQTVENLKEISVKGNGAEIIKEVLGDISSNRMVAAQKLRSYLKRGGDSHKFVAESRKVLFEKGRDAHDYKFSSAVLEDYGNVSTQWRDEFLAMSVFNLKGLGHRDNGLNKRIKSATS